MNRGGGVSGGAASAPAPTGCYKCGRPGHWSRDCPSSSSNPNNNSNHPTPPLPRPPLPLPLPPQKKTQRRSRPKLTPDILLSDRGIGHILRYFPRALKCRGRGRGREFHDLQHLLGLYAEWHSRLLPYYNFDQFIHKVEQVGATKRVKVCLRELRDRVADGVDPTKLHEPQVEENSIDGQEEGLDMNNFEENSIWDKGIEEICIATGIGIAGDGDKDKDQDESSKKNEMTEEERSRMEANRLKALERAAVRAKIR